MRIDFVDRVVAGGAWSGDEEIALRAEGEVIGGDAGLEGGEDEDLAVAGDLEDGAAAVADVEVLLAIEGDSGGDAHAFGVHRHGSVGRDFVDGLIVARGNIHLVIAVESDGGCIHQVTDEGLDVVAGVNLEDGDGSFLAARSGESDVDVAFAIEGGIGDGMEAVRDRNGDLDGMRIADVSVGTDDNVAGSGSVGNAGDDEVVGTDEHRAFHFSEAHAGTAEFVGMEAFAADANFASGQSKGRRNRVDMRFAVDVLLTQETIGYAHELDPAENATDFTR